MLRSAFFVLALGLVVAACASRSAESGDGNPVLVEEAASTALEPVDPTPDDSGPDLAAPEFPVGIDWLNTDRPLAMAQLRGKVVVLDFWTYGCINCIHIIPDLKRLEEEYADELVVIGVHSAKFENEASTENIREIILRYDLEHPVINDSDFVVWQTYGAQAWPTLFMIDPVGDVVGFHAGEGVYDLFEPIIGDLVEEFDARGEIDRTSLGLKLEREGLPETVLSYPGKVTVDGERDRLFIADTNHHRVVQASLEGEVQAVFGSGQRGYADAPGLEAAFDQPQGMAITDDGSTLYVSDLGNHAIRSIDLATGAVSTLTGTGRQAPWPPNGGAMPATPLNSPWDLELDGDQLYVAMAGTHQIWLADLAAQTVGPYAGSAIEGTANGAGAQAELAQPSGLTLAEDGRLYFADSESSAIRYVDTTADDRAVSIAAGSDINLFDFGDVDGAGTEARLQHPLGVVAVGDTVWFADTYNSKIKTVQADTLDVMTVAGAETGWRDGGEPLFFEPGGLDHYDGTLYVADTNNHSVRTLDTESGEVSTLILSGIEAFLPDADSAAFGGTILELDPIDVAAGPGQVVLEVVIPDGYKVNPQAPSRFDWRVEGGVAALAPDASGTRINPSFPLTFEATFQAGSGSLVGDLSIVYCDAEAESICLIEQLRVVAPLSVGTSGTSTPTLTHTIVLPDV